MADDIYGDSEALIASLTIKTAAGAKYTVRAALTESVLQLKEKVQVESGVAVAQQKLIYAGSILKDDRTLESYGVKDGYTVHLVKAPAPTPAPAARPATSCPGTTSSTPTAAPAPATQPAAQPTAQPQSPFGLGDSRFAQMHQQMMGNPEMMRQAMDNPMVRSIMSNPEMMRNILMSNPEMRAMVEANPEIGHMLNDPATLRQVSDMMRNPNLMQEMVRNTDRAMSNIEAHPEGFNHLRRMYQNIQEPMQRQAASQPTQQPGNVFDDLFTNPATETPAEPATTALPNPWAPSAPSRPAQAQTQRPTGFGANPFMFPTAMPTAAPTSGAQATQPPTGTNPSVNPFAALGGNPLPGQPDADSIIQIMDNPYAQQMMTQISQNPEMFQQMVNSNPFLRQMMESNPMHRELMNNPDMIRIMFNPDVMRSAAELRRNMRGGAGAPTHTIPTDLFAGLYGANPSTTAQPTAPAVPPQQLFASQLQQLRDMGFYDEEANIRALQATRGNVSLAVERLLQGL